jgi:membrane fusion protein (multidrug efflux system)
VYPRATHPACRSTLAPATHARAAGRDGWRLLFGIALLCSACRRPAPAPADGAQSVILGPENVIAVKEDRIDIGPTLSGSLEARQRSVIVAEASGSVEAAPVELGQSVKRGQLLARIEARALENAAQSARTSVEARRQSLALAERQAERIGRLVQAGALAEHERELAQNEVASQGAQLAQAQAALASAQRQLEGAVVRSPLEGVISQKSVHQGDVVTLGSPLFVIIDPSSMRLSASVPSESLAVLRVGAPVEFRVRGLGEQSFSGSIERVGPAADPVTRQIPLLVSLPNPGGRLVAGLFAEGRVAAEQRTALVVPSAALSQAGEGVSVRRLKDGHVQVVPVSVGIEDPTNERVEITSGLAAGDQVLTGAARDLQDGTPVRVEASAS